jgi:hypothetical protein
LQATLAETIPIAVSRRYCAYNMAWTQTAQP